MIIPAPRVQVSKSKVCAQHQKYNSYLGPVRQLFGSFLCWSEGPDACTGPHYKF